MNAYNHGIWLGQGRMNAPPTGVPPRNYYRRGGIYAALVYADINCLFIPHSRMWLINHLQLGDIFCA